MGELSIRFYSIRFGRGLPDPFNKKRSFITHSERAATVAPVLAIAYMIRNDYNISTKEYKGGDTVSTGVKKLRLRTEVLLVS